MQFLHSKKIYLKKKIKNDLDLALLKAIRSISNHSDDLTFTQFLQDNPHYTKYHNYNYLIQEYSIFLQTSFIVLIADFYEEVYSFKYLRYRLLMSKFYFNTLHKAASDLEIYINIAKENYLSLAINALDFEDLLPEAPTH